MTTPEDREIWERDEAELRRQAEDAAITASLERSDAHFRAVLADAPAEHTPGWPCGGQIKCPQCAAEGGA
jgi:hypothetical protein